MYINKFKKCKPIDLDSKLKEYVIKNYDNESLTEKVKSYFSELSQNRNVLSQMGEVQDGIDQLKTTLDILTGYLNMLSAIKQKMTFGKESYSCKIEFIWTDTIKESKWNSYNIFFEIYNVMFNLATCYYNLGYQTGKAATEKSGHRDASKYYKHAMYLYDVIKEEAGTKIIEKELPYDLYPSHLDYCKTICEIQGQLEIYAIAKETNPKGFDLHAKILCYVSELYGKARSLADNPQTKKNTKDDYLNFLANRAIFYRALMCQDIRENYKKRFDDVGQNFGEMLVHQGLFVQSLLECEKTLKKCGNLVDIPAFQKMLEDEKARGQDMDRLNNTIYHQVVPNPDTLTFDKKAMMAGMLPEGLYIRENSEKLKNDEKAFCTDLELLVPKQVKGMINNYKTKMNEFIGKNLDMYENEQTIQNFVQNLFLPKKLTLRPGEEDLSSPPAEFPPQLWQKIEQIQQMGGTEKLSRTMQGIMNKSNYLINELENLLKSLEAEDNDDQQCRQRFRDKWIREPSQKLNYKLVQGAQHYISSLNNTKKFDMQENNEIMDNARFFEELLLPREQLLNKIPKREELEEKEIPEEREIREAIQKLYELGDKCMGIIKPIFNELNDDSHIVGQFIEVLAKKTTEQAIYDKFKEIYEQKFVELKPISDQIRQQKDVVDQLVQKNSQKIRDKPKQAISNEAMEFFRTLDQYANMYMNKYEKVRKGDKYYNDLYQKISQLLKTADDWMIKRSEEKNAILSTIKGASGGGLTRLTSSKLMDPAQNPFTNMNVNINKQGNYGMQFQNNNMQNRGGYNNQQGGFGPQQGGFGPQQGGFGPNQQQGFGGNRGF
jgi:hypothetical protein